MKYIDRIPGRLEALKSSISRDSRGFKQSEKLSNEVDAHFAAT